MYSYGADDADLVPVFAIWRCLASFTVQAVRERGNEGLRHQGCKASAVEGLGGGEGHGTHGAPMKCSLHSPQRLEARKLRLPFDVRGLRLET